jgi:hypothetical protein
VGKRGVGGKLFCLFFFFVPNVFSTCAQHVPSFEIPQVSKLFP